MFVQIHPIEQNGVTAVMTQAGKPSNFQDFLRCVSHSLGVEDGQIAVTEGPGHTYWLLKLYFQMLRLGRHTLFKSSPLLFVSKSLLAASRRGPDLVLLRRAPDCHALRHLKMYLMWREWPCLSHGGLGKLHSLGQILIDFNFDTAVQIFRVSVSHAASINVYVLKES